MSFLQTSRSGIWILFCFLSLRGLGQLPATPITDSLKKDAVMVVRKNEMEIEIISPRKAKMVHRYIYTILNSRGDVYANAYTFYDKFHDLVSVTGVLYDGEGRQLKKIRKGDMQDWNIDGSGILMSDIRVKYYPFTCRSYPYTISYAEEVEMNGLFMLPEWRPQPERNVSVENSSLVIKTPAGYPLRYKAYHYPGEVLVSDIKGEKVYTWQMNYRPALAEEPYEPAWFHLATSVRLVPGEFELQGYKGSLYSWADVGKFVGTLYQGRDQLPDEAKRKVHELVDGLTDDRKKIDVLYRFLQHNTHYVGIELGIGGWQPFDAASVYYKRYGDCKALSNYMVALLKEAGIRASNVLIRGGGDVPALDTAFACPQFNHAIAVAFTGKDSVWLECTSALLAPGYLGSFTADRDALLIDPAGSHIIHTPAYGVRENHLDRRVEGHISLDGKLDASLTCGYTGLEQDALQWRIDQLTKKDLLAERRAALGIQDVTVRDLSYAFDSSGIPAIRETMSLVAGQFATISGNRLLISPGYFLRRGSGLKEEHSRPFELSLSYEETDSISLLLPPGYEPEGNPMNASFSCPCGSYRIHGVFSEGVYTITCHFQQNKGSYDAAAWPRLVRLFNLVHREGDRQLVFVRH